MQFDKFLIKNFKIYKIDFQIFKGNILNETEEKKRKMQRTPFHKVFTSKNAERIYLDKIPSIEKKIGKCKKTDKFFWKKENISIDKILPEENWFNKFETHWLPTEESAERS